MKPLLMILVLASQAVFAGDLQQSGWPFLNERDGAYTVITCKEDLTGSPNSANAIRFYHMKIDDVSMLEAITATDVWFQDCKIDWAELAKWEQLKKIAQFRFTDTDFINNSKPKQVSSVLSQLTKVESFWLDGYLFGIVYPDEEGFDENFNSNEFLLSHLAKYSNLTKLRLDSIDIEKDSEWAMLAGMTGLKQLFIPNCGCEDKHILKIIENMELEALEIYTYSLKDTTVLKIAEEDNLKYLSFSSDYANDQGVKFTEEIAKALSKNKNLHTLIFSFFRVENDKVFDYLTDCKQLTRLEMSFHTTFDGDASYNSEWIAKLNKLNQLHTLVLNMYYEMSDEDFAQIKALPKLEVLDLCYADKLTAKTMKVVHRFPLLRELRVNFEMGEAELSRLAASKTIIVFDNGDHSDTPHPAINADYFRSSIIFNLRKVTASIKAVVSFLESNSEVKAVELGSFESCSEPELKALFAALKNVHCLDMSSSVDVTESISALISGLNLRALCFGFSEDKVKVSQLEYFKGIRFLSIADYDKELVLDDEVPANDLNVFLLEIDGMKMDVKVAEWLLKGKNLQVLAVCRGSS